MIVYIGRMNMTRDGYGTLMWFWASITIRSSRILERQWATTTYRSP